MSEIRRLITKQLIREVERLTERLSNKNPCQRCSKRGADCDGCEEYAMYVDKLEERLAEYETAEDEGRLVVLPCNTVYFIWNKSSGISHVRAKSILDLSLCEILGIDKYGRYWSVKEEAEKALKEMKKNE